MAGSLKHLDRWILGLQIQEASDWLEQNYFNRYFQASVNVRVYI